MKIILIVFFIFSAAYSQQDYSQHTAISIAANTPMYISTYSDIYTEEPEYYYYEYYYEDELPQASPTNIYSPPYKTFNYERFKTKTLPKLSTTDSMLSNLNGSFWSGSFWSLKYTFLYPYIDVSFKGSTMTLSTLDAAENLLSENSYVLTPIKMFKPNDGIFAFPDKDGQIRFVYMHLLLEHLLAIKLVSTFEEAEEASKQSLTDLGVFTLR